MEFLPCESYGQVLRRDRSKHFEHTPLQREREIYNRPRGEFHPSDLGLLARYVLGRCSWAVAEGAARSVSAIAQRRRKRATSRRLAARPEPGPLSWYPGPGWNDRPPGGVLRSSRSLYAVWKLRVGFLAASPERLIGDRAYDSDGLDERLREGRGIELIARHRSNRRRAKTQDAAHFVG